VAEEATIADDQVRLEGDVKSRKLNVVYAALVVGVVILGVGSRAEEGISFHMGVVQDWTQHNIVFTRDGIARHPDVLYREPRVLFKAIQRWNSADMRALPAAQAQRQAVSSALTNVTAQRDWSVTLGAGRLLANVYPAKYSFNPALPPDCTNDYVVFGLNVAGTTGGQANLVAFNNLYAGLGGLCGANPTVMFAYNITTSSAGKVVTSPTLSLDGTQIAFVESNATAGTATFHVLTWTAGQGGILTAAAPTMTSLTYSTTANDTSSSPYVDYSSDTAYVGADDGNLYVIHPVFKGTPAVTASYLVSRNFHLTSPVLDDVLGVVMVGATDGSLYQINLTTGAKASLAVGKKSQRGAGIVATPIVDVTNGTTFAVSGNDGTSGVLVQADTATMTQLQKVRIGLAGASGTTINLHQPDLTNNYYNSPSNGLIRVCGTGTADTTPWQYAFGFSGRTMRNTVSFARQLLPSATARCTDWSEFFNPNVNGGTDFFFFGLTRDCTGVGAANGCVAVRSSNTVIATATVAGGPSGIVLDNYSTAGQASSIYFTAVNVNTAYKMTQSGLQ
jgi:hypothetical protein